VTSLHSKLFAWHRLQLQCDEARQRLKQAMASLADDAAVQALHAEIERLCQEMDAMLRELEAMRAQRAQAGEQGS